MLAVRMKIAKILRKERNRSFYWAPRLERGESADLRRVFCTRQVIFDFLEDSIRNSGIEEYLKGKRYSYEMMKFHDLFNIEKKLFVFFQNR